MPEALNVIVESCIRYARKDSIWGFSANGSRLLFLAIFSVVQIRIIRGSPARAFFPGA